MAAYAALVSLLNTIDQIHDHPRLSFALQQNQIQLLQQNLLFLLHFLERGPHRGSQQESEILEHQIASAAYAAEDVIETHIVDQIEASGSISLLDLQTVVQDMDYVKEKVVTFKDEIGLIEDLKPAYYPSSASTSTSSELETPLTMVGLDDELIRLMDALTGRQSILQIIPIVGMGGIGKTTLAKNVYENPLISQHFDVRAWATISQEYSIKDIFSNLLSSESKSTIGTEYQQLALEFYQSLIGRRYLLVLDDMWSIEVWDKIKFFFPDNNNGSRVVVTTRLSNMATRFGTSLFPLKLLDEDNSWKLFCQKAAFPQQGGCASELVQFGKKIVEKCGGLPLLIVVIGALLRNSSRTQEYWEYWVDISANMNSNLNTNEEEIKCLDILCLSYRHLPAHLKPCFLYLGIFPEDNVIRSSQLIKLWVAEGFVRSNKTQSLEEIAQGYLKDLLDRNLLYRSSLWRGKTKTCRMHDLLRELCLKLAEKENFLCVMKAGDHVANTGRRIVFQRGTTDGLESVSPLSRSLLSDVDLRWIKFKLLRVLKASDSYYSMDYISKQVNLRYVFIYQLVYDQNHRNLVPSISTLWNLQMLIIRTGQPFFAPPEIWEMRQLRHVDILTVCLPDPPLSSNQPENEVVLRNLQSIKTAWNLRLSEEVCKRILNVKKLVIYYTDLSGNSYDFGRLRSLEKIGCSFCKNPNSDDLLQSFTFPSSLRKLTLEGCHLRWEDLSVIGSLPRLVGLRLKEKSVMGSEWSPVEGEFLHLRSLDICGSDLINWNADDSSFPALEKLVLNGLENLSEIPSGIGEIPSLSFIVVSSCSVSAAISAMEILEEQESLGNKGLQALIYLWRKEDFERFKENVEHMECFTSTNLQLL